jgi:hypothetical protein
MRPSALPKLAECPRYESSGGSSDAANRGTALDAAFRNILTGTAVGWSPDANKEDVASIEWAVNTARLLAGTKPILADEDDLRIECLGMTGTADAACPDAGWSADLKTGQVRNYLEQQAAYALGFMDKYFESEWTVHLLFSDERRVVTHTFTLESAEVIVREVMARVNDEHAQATPCDYCSWCAKRFTCETRLLPLSTLLTGAPDKLDINAIKADSAKLGEILAITKDIGDLHDELKSAAVETMVKGEQVPGWRLQKGRETKTVPALQLAANLKGKNLLEAAGSQRVLSELGNLSADKFGKLWTETFSEPMPESIIQTNHGSPFAVRQKQTKNKQTKD